MKRTQAWFPTQIYTAPIQSNWQRFNRELLKECHQLRDFDEEGRRWSQKNYPGGYTSYGSMDKLHTFSSTFGDLERFLNRHVRNFVGGLDWDLGGRSLVMTDCWVNIMPKGVVHSLHLHPLSAISGTYYVATPKGCSGLKFEDPRLDRFMAAPPRRADVRNSNRLHVTYPAKAGYVTLFESWLRHEVPASPVTAERISISFNYAWS
ncbi:MAG TPA: TIGR02466 family protein [Candidatus Limnocylindria bacterium]|nr:TIGR02466 family protein [Candidatus Limnocylindria bacterium]